MSYNDDYYYYENNNGGGLGLIILVSIILIPVIPAGDISIYLIDNYYKDAPNFVYIFGWLGFSFSWGYLWFKLLSKMFDNFWIVIAMLYLQGVVFICLIAQTKYAAYSKYVYSFLHSIFIGNN